MNKKEREEYYNKLGAKDVKITRNSDGTYKEYIGHLRLGPEKRTLRSCWLLTKIWIIDKLSKDLCLVKNAYINGGEPFGVTEKNKTKASLISYNTLIVPTRVYKTKYMIMANDKPQYFCENRFLTNWNGGKVDELYIDTRKEANEQIKKTNKWDTEMFGKPIEDKYSIRRIKVPELVWKEYKDEM